MLKMYLNSKIHRATVTDSNLNYVGSITISDDLLVASGISEYEKVQVVNVNNGKRIETYVIRGRGHSGIICLNGAAARYFQKGDIIIIMSYCLCANEEVRPKVVIVNEKNEAVSIGYYKEFCEIDRL